MVGAVLDVPRRPVAPASEWTYRRRRASAFLVVVLVVLGACLAWSRLDTVRQVHAATAATAEHVTRWGVERDELSVQIDVARELLTDAEGTVADPTTLTALSAAITVADTVAPPAAIRPVPAGAGVDTARSLERVAAAVVARQRAAAEALDAAVKAVQDSRAQYERAHAAAAPG